jgi:3-phenylpropionate/trans-cinnamate dioxygenase ferredoxin reductase subunit
MSYRYLIIGGGLAGGRACQGIRQVDTDGAVALVAAEAHRPYERPALSKGFLRGQEPLDHLYVDEADFYEQHGVELITGVAATSIDRAAHRVMLADGRELGYEKLLLATGGSAIRLPLPGAELPGAMTLRTIEDALALREAAAAGGPAVVLGGSFIGAEVAASLAQMGLAVDLVFPEKRLLERLGPPELSAAIAARFSAHGVAIWPGTLPERLEGEGRVQRIVLQDGRTLPAGLVAMGVGSRLTTAWAREAGRALAERGAGVGDENLASSAADIYAAGDIAAWPGPRGAGRLRVEHWDVARRQGLRAGRNMAGDVRPYRALPYFFSDLFDLSLEVWGDPARREATALRGDLKGAAFTLFGFFGGRLTSAVAAGATRAARKALPALVEAGLGLDAAEALADSGIELAALVPGSPA